MGSPKRASKRAIKRGMELEGMEAHITRKKASWRTSAPSDAILDNWIRFKVSDMIRSHLLMNKTTEELIDMYDQLTLEDEK